MSNHKHTISIRNKLMLITLIISAVVFTSVGFFINRSVSNQMGNSV